MFLFFGRVLAVALIGAVLPFPVHAGSGLAASFEPAAARLRDAGDQVGRMCRELPRYPVLRKTGMSFTADEAAMVYPRYYHCAMPRLPYHWRPSPDGSALAVLVFREKPRTLRIPAEFIEAVSTHIEAVLKETEARFLFPIDFDHGHFSLPKEDFIREYPGFFSDGGIAPMMAKALADSELEIVYHSQEFIHPRINPREFLGTFDGAPRVVPTASIPGWGRERAQRRERIYDFEFHAHPKGEFRLSDGTRFDMSFQSENPLDAYFERIGVRVEYPPERER